MFSANWKTIFSKRKDETPKEIQERINETRGPFLAKTVLCIIYAYFGDLPLEIYHTKVHVRNMSFKYKDGEYIVKTKGNIKIKKAPWYSLGTQYIAVLEYIEGNPMPVMLKQPETKIDSQGLARVTSKASRVH